MLSCLTYKNILANLDVIINMFQNNSEIAEKLEELGLSQKEAEVYLKLAKFNKVGIGKLAIETGLTRQNLYNYLDSLKDKGLAGEIVENGRKKFFVREIKNLGMDLKNKLDLVNLLDEEMAEYQLHYSSGIKLYKGKKKIQRLFIERMKRQSRGDEFFVTETSWLDFTDKLMGRSFSLYENMRINRKVKVYVLIVLESNLSAKEHKELNDNQRLYNETRVIKQAPFGFSALYVWKDRVWVLLKNRDEYEIIEIINQDVVKSFGFYFETVWERGEVVYKSED